MKNIFTKKLLNVHTKQPGSFHFCLTEPSYATHPFIHVQVLELVHVGWCFRVCSHAAVSCSHYGWGKGGTTGYCLTLSPLKQWMCECGCEMVEGGGMRVD